MPIIYKQALAEQDLIDIWLYTFDQWGEAQADRYLDGLDSAIRLLAENPLICREREEFQPPVRIYHYQHHLVVYLTMSEKNGVRVIRVLHKSMDIDTHLSSH